MWARIAAAAGLSAGAVAPAGWQMLRVLRAGAGRAPARGSVAAALTLLAAVAIVPSAEAAQICAPRKITASGAPSNFGVLARSRAKSAWISKVSQDPRLGPVFAQWLKSKERRVVCRKVASQRICIAAAIPCRNATAKAPTPPKPSASLRPL